MRRFLISEVISSFKEALRLSKRLFSIRGDFGLDGPATSTSWFGVEVNDFLQEDINLLKHPVSTKISRVPAPWREKVRCLSLGSHNYLYMDERLVIPKALRPTILRSLH